MTHRGMMVKPKMIFGKTQEIPASPRGLPSQTVRAD